MLVRYNPEGDAELNGRQTARLAQLSDYCRPADRRFMFELLVPATTAQMDRAEGNTQIFDRQIRPGLMLQTIRALQDAGVIGFAVGRTTFWDAVADYQARKTTRQEALTRIADRYREWVARFERASTRSTILGFGANG